MSKLVLAIAICGLFIMSACAWIAEYSKTTQHHFQAKSVACGFDILMSRPDRKFVEVGILEGLWCGGDCKTAAEARKLMRPYVCRAGGDAVIVFANGIGHYKKGVIIKYQ